MAAPKAPVLDSSGKKAKDVTLAEGVFAAEVRPHLVHEAVRAEAAAARSGTKAAKSRSLVSGGRSKPRSFNLKVNRKAHRAAFRAALSDHAQRGTLAVIDGGAFAEPSTREASALVAAWGADRPLLVIAQPEEETLVKSFRNLTQALVLEPSELEVGAIVWARSVLATEDALERITEVVSR
jgi:large subunit ribosomal protein L4